MSLSTLPPELIGKILDVLDTKERARLSVLNKFFRSSSEACWGVMRLSFSTLRELEALRKWLEAFAQRGCPASLQELDLFWKGGALHHPAAGNLHIERFAGLEILRLKPPYSTAWVVTSKALKRLQPLSRLKQLELAFAPTMYADQPGSVTLYEFAAFSKLQDLKIHITVAPNRAGSSLQLSPQLESLVYLRTLSLSSGKLVLVANETLRAICRQLTTFCSQMKSNLGQGLEVPNLETLVLDDWRKEEAFPFSGQDRLRSLVTDQSCVLHSLCSFPGLQQLTLEPPIALNEHSIHSLAPLQQLTQICIGSYIPSEIETFETLARLSRLETIAVRIEGRPQELRPALSRLPHLRSLSLSSVFDDVRLNFDGQLADCAALEELHVANLRLVEPISSPTLVRLSLGGAFVCIRPTSPCFGSLLNLRSLKLNLLAMFVGWEVLADQLAALPQLEELHLIKSYAHVLPSSCRPHEDQAGVFERMLHSLGRLSRLRTVQVAAVNDSVSLSRTVLPRVEHFSLACKGLSVCYSCLPWPVRSMELVFRSANGFTLSLLEDNAFVSDDTYGKTVFYRAQYPSNQPLTCEIDAALLEEADD